MDVMPEGLKQQDMLAALSSSDVLEAVSKCCMQDRIISSGKVKNSHVMLDEVRMLRPSPLSTGGSPSTRQSWRTGLGGASFRVRPDFGPLFCCVSRGCRGFLRIRFIRFSVGFLSSKCIFECSCIRVMAAVHRACLKTSFVPKGYRFRGKWIVDHSPKAL